jgi:hypothetical protein
MSHWIQKCEIWLQTEHERTCIYDTQYICKSPLNYAQVTSECKFDKFNTQGNHTWVITAWQNENKLEHVQSVSRLGPEKVQTHLRLKDTTLNIFTAPAPFTTHQAP